MTPIERAHALAKRRGVRTSAQTLKGILRAIKAGSAGPPPAPRRTNRPATRVRIREVLNTSTQAPRDRARTLPPHSVLKAVVEAAVSRTRRSDCRVGAVPNRYKGTAYESYACAVRQGRAIRFAGGRTDMPQTTGGVGGRTMTADQAAIFILLDDLWTAFPPMPRGWAFGTDGLGLRMFFRPTGWDYHPTGNDLANVIHTQSWADLLVRIMELAARRRAYQRNDRTLRRIALIRKLAPTLEIKLSDSIAAGNCEAGTRSWARQHGIGGDATTFNEVGSLAASDRRLALTIIHAFRRTRMERQAART